MCDACSGRERLENMYNESFSTQAMTMAVEYVELLSGMATEKRLCDYVGEGEPLKTRAEAYLYLLGMTEK